MRSTRVALLTGLAGAWFAGLAGACSQDLGLDALVFRCATQSDCASGFLCAPLVADPQQTACLPASEVNKRPPPDVTDAVEPPDVAADPGPAETSDADIAAADLAPETGPLDADASAPDEGPDVAPECVTGQDCLDALGVHAPCNLATCDAGQCVVTLPPQPPGCDDGDPCTHSEKCVSGQCQVTAFECPVEVEAMKPCWVGVCQNNARNPCDFEQMADTCFVDDGCFADGDPDPANECRVCTPKGQAVQAFVDVVDGAPCAAGAGACQAGTCVVPE